MIFIMIVLIGDAESVCDMKECSDSLLDCCHWLIMRSRRCKDYKNHFAHLLMVMKIACAPILNSMSQIALFCKSACSFAPHIH